MPRATSSAAAIGCLVLRDGVVKAEFRCARFQGNTIFALGVRVGVYKNNVLVHETQTEINTLTTFQTPPFAVAAGDIVHFTGWRPEDQQYDWGDLKLLSTVSELVAI